MQKAWEVEVADAVEEGGGERKEAGVGDKRVLVENWEGGEAPPLSIIEGLVGRVNLSR